METSILKVQITNLDAPSNIHQTVLLSHERETKNIYIQACLDQRRHFSSFVAGVLGNEVKVVLQNLSGSLAKKSGKSYSETSNSMNSKMSIENCTSRTSVHARITEPREPNEPTEHRRIAHKSQHRKKVPRRKFQIHTHRSTLIHTNICIETFLAKIMSQGQ